jgi:hypothetical protein
VSALDRRCGQCGDELPASQGRWRYCSTRCAAEAQRKREKVRSLDREPRPRAWAVEWSPELEAAAGELLAAMQRDGGWWGELLVARQMARLGLTGAAAGVVVDQLVARGLVQVGGDEGCRRWRVRRAG